MTLRCFTASPLWLSVLTGAILATVSRSTGSARRVLARLTFLALSLLQPLFVDQSRLEQLLVQGISHPGPLGLGRGVGTRRVSRG